jgi:hypothetical protein
MIEFACKGGSKWKQCHLTHDWNMCAFAALEDFIARANAHRIFTIIMKTPQVTQVTNFLETKPRTILNIGCDHLAPSMAIILYIHALHL